MGKGESPGGYPATVLARLTFDCKLRPGAEPGAVMRKEFPLSGVRRPLYRGESGPDAVEVFRFGDFVGWLIDRGGDQFDRGGIFGTGAGSYCATYGYVDTNGGMFSTRFDRV